MKKRIIFKLCFIFLFQLFIYKAHCQDLINIIDIKNYINSFSSLQGKFEQYESDSSDIKYGNIYIDKPHDARWEYYYPEKFIINISGAFTTYYNEDLDQAINLFTDYNITNLLSGDFKSLDNSDLSYVNNTAYLKIKDDKNLVTFKFQISPITLQEIEISKDNNIPTTKILFSDLKYNIPINYKVFSKFGE